MRPSPAIRRRSAFRPATSRRCTARLWRPPEHLHGDRLPARLFDHRGQGIRSAAGPRRRRERNRHGRQPLRRQKRRLCQGSPRKSARLKQIAGAHVLKVIVETCYLTEAEKVALCRCVTDGGADYIKTSTRLRHRRRHAGGHRAVQGEHRARRARQGRRRHPHRRSRRGVSRRWLRPHWQPAPPCRRSHSSGKADAGNSLNARRESECAGYCLRTTGCASWAAWCG